MQPEELKSGFTIASFLAIVYAIVVFVPAMMYLQLMIGLGGITVAWFTLILWTEIARFSGRGITKQEAAMIYLLSAAEIYIPLGFVQRAYYRNSAIYQAFGIADKVPNWWVPPPETGIWEARLLLHPAWGLPIGVAFLSTAVSLVLTFSLAAFTYDLFSRIEKLPFPLQQMAADGILVLSGEGGEQKLRYLFLFGLIGFVYGNILYSAPFILQAWTGQAVQLIPVPWIDLNTAIERFLPGASLGIATDLSPIAAALVLPASTVVSIAVGSFAIYFFGNWLTVAYNLSPTPWWLPGMNLQMSAQRSILYFWAAPTIGLGLAAGITPLIRHPQAIRRAVSHLIPRSTSKEEIKPIASWKTFLLPYTLCSIVGILFFIILAPAFPVWIMAPLIIGMPLISTLIGGRMLGETGIGYSSQAGTISNLLYLASGYPGVDVWFVPNISGVTGDDTAARFKVAELTSTKISSYIKMYLAAFPIAVVVGFAFVQVFWSIAPIPSGTYPGAAIFWPISATYSALWIKGVGLDLFNPTWLLGAFVAGSAIYLAFSFIPAIPLSFVAIAAGAGTLTPFAVTYLIGTAIMMTLRRFTGAKWWDEHKTLLAAGMMMGEGIAISLSISVVLVINSIWVSPY